ELREAMSERGPRRVSAYMTLATLGQNVDRLNDRTDGIFRDLPIRPSVVVDLVAVLRLLDHQIETLERAPASMERSEALRELENRAGIATRTFRQRFARVREKEQMLIDAKR